MAILITEISVGDWWYKWLIVALSSAVKFIGGPVSGLALSLTWFETVVFTVVGAMISIVTVAWGGTQVREFIKTRISKPKKKFTQKNRIIIKAWGKYGLWGVAFLTPLLLTPIGGTLIAVSFGESVQKIFLFMLVSVVAWGVIITSVLYYVKDWLWAG